jgi:hypothetical protein
MLPDGKKDTAPSRDRKEDAGVQDNDPYLVSLISLTQDSEQPQSEAIMTVADELQGTALRRRTQLLKPDS